MNDELRRKISFKYELLSKTNIHKKWLYNVIDCQLSWQSLTQLKSSANITMKDDKDIDFINDRIRVYASINDNEFVLGTFLLCSSSKTTNIISTRKCECYSLLQILLDMKIRSKMQIVAGTNIINEVIRLIGQTGSYTIQASEKTLLGEKIYEVGTTYLEIINDLLDTASYTTLYTDRLGNFIAKPYILPQDRQHSITLKADIKSLVKPEIVSELDLFNIPNVFTVYTNSLDVTPMTYTYINNRPNSKTSTVSRGREIGVSEQVEATNMNDLILKAKSMCNEANSKFEHLDLEVALRSDLNLYDDCIWVKLHDIDSKYVLYNAQYTCKVGECMKLKLRKVVDLFG